MTTLSYIRTLERAWDRYTVDGLDGSAPRVPRIQGIRVTEEVKVKHLTDFMASNKEHGTTIKAYEDQVGLPNGNVVTYTNWLIDGRLASVQEGELLDFFTARRAASKVVKREKAHEK